MNRLNLVGLTFGALFGFVLAWAGMSDADAIRDMLLLRSFDLYLAMGAAMMTGLAGVQLLKRLQVKSVLDGKPLVTEQGRPTRNTVVGSVIFGLGWSIACTCPGPVAAQIGGGQLLAVAVVVGILIGAYVRGVTSAPTPAAAKP